MLFRRLDGEAAAIADQCAHRFAPLSRGKLCGEHVECPYHGLRYDHAGTCVENPHGSGRIPSALHITSYPVVERHTLAWIWIGDDYADPDLIPDFSHLDEGAPGVVSKRDWMELDVDYRLMSDNLLDLSHVNFLHDGILGHPGKIDAEVEITERGDRQVTVTRLNHDVAPARIFDMMWRNDGANVDAWAEMRWDAPGNLRNHAGVCEPGGRREDGLMIIGSHLLTPITATRVRYHIAAVRIGDAPGQDDAETAEQLTLLRRFAFEEQDRPMVEAQQRAYDRAGGPDALKPVMLSIDSGPLRARRKLDALIAAERAAQLEQEMASAAPGGGAPVALRRRQPVG